MYSKTFAILMLLGSCSGDNLQITSNGTTSVAKAHLKYTSLSQNPNGPVATGAEDSNAETDLEEIMDVSWLVWAGTLPIITAASAVILGLSLLILKCRKKDIELSPLELQRKNNQIFTLAFFIGCVPLIFSLIAREMEGGSYSWCFAISLIWEIAVVIWGLCNKAGFVGYD